VFHCATCHGRTGRGDGPDALLFTPKPTDLHEGFLERHDTERLVRRILDGASLLLPFDPAALRVRADDTEALVAHLHAIPREDWRLIGRGQRIYMVHCQACHGIFGRAEAARPSASERVPPPLLSAAARRSLGDADLLAAVRHRRRGMTPIPALREEDDPQALAAFVRVLTPGFKLYSLYCADCHGYDGHPTHLVEPARRPRVIFDAQYLARRDPDGLRVAVLHMLEESKPTMPHFRGELSESGARAIIEYLRGTR
jgi:mono/diheme cytochrome c family protein